MKGWKKSTKRNKKITRSFVINNKNTARNSILEEKKIVRTPFEYFSKSIIRIRRTTCPITFVITFIAQPVFHTTHPQRKRRRLRTSNHGVFARSRHVFMFDFYFYCFPAVSSQESSHPLPFLSATTLAEHALMTIIRSSAMSLAVLLLICCGFSIVQAVCDCIDPSGACVTITCAPNTTLEVSTDRVVTVCVFWWDMKVKRCIFCAWRRFNNA